MKKFNKILLIDDDPITNFINEAVLKLANITEIIKITLNGAEAINYIKNDCWKENSYPDLILVDINMPIMDGFEFVKQFRELKQKEIGKPIIAFLTTSSDIRDENMSKDLGIPMLKKPLSLEMINELFGGEILSVKKAK